MEQEQLLRRRDVEATAKLSRSAIYAAMARGEFPAPVRIGARSVRWRSSDVQAWIESRPLAREAEA